MKTKKTQKAKEVSKPDRKDPLDYFEPAKPLEFLYTYTVKTLLDGIKTKGLKAMDDRIPLSLHSEPSEPKAVLERIMKVAAKYKFHNETMLNEEDLVILKISALRMYNDGYIFYAYSDEIWDCDEVPAKYIECLNL